METQQRQETTPDRKLEDRFRKWKFADDIEFASPDVKQAYQRRVQMFIDVIRLKKPERIPVFPMSGFYHSSTPASRPGKRCTITKSWPTR